METLVPASAADLLWNVPSVFVNSTLGEIRNVVYSRGVSANTSNGDLGYYYVSMQEDGLPVTNISYSNWGPDYFMRPDVTLERVEAVRGGSASITAANAPGGVFNYISRSGTPAYGGEVRGRFGLEGNEQPYYRADLLIGGPVGKTGWVYSLGGFYRESRGARYAGYDMNEGGQIRLNISKDYGAGTIKLNVKYLDDYNGWFEFLPAKNFDDPEIAPGVDRFGTNLHRPGKFRYVTGSAATSKVFDPTDLAHSTQRAIGATWSHELGDGWAITNNFKLSDSRSNWNTSASTQIRSIGWGSLYSYANIGNNSGVIPAGTIVLTDRTTGQVAARIASDGTARSGNNDGLTVLENNLPNQHLLDGGVWANNALVFERDAGEAMEQVVVSKRVGKMLFVLGGFYGYADLRNFNTSAGRSISPLISNPTPYDITIETPTGGAYGGQTLQITNPSGFSAEGNGWTLNEAEQNQLALFFGYNWEIARPLTFDWGVRYEHLSVKGLNNQGALISGANYVPTYGGADGNPLTIYDNRFSIRNAMDWRYNRSLDTFSYSAAINYTINKNNSVYLRYSNGEKAPDFSFFTTLTSTWRLENYETISQKVEQWELGYKFRIPNVTIILTPFYSKLDDIFAANQFTDVDNSYYSPDPLYNAIETYGVEAEFDYTLNQYFSIRAVATWQDSEATKWQVWIANQPGPADDELQDFSGNPADNNPDWIINVTPTSHYKKFTASFSWKYMGKRPANVANIFTMPDFYQVDLMVRYDFNDRFSVSLNVNNAFDGEGVMNWAGWARDSSPFNRQSFTSIADPNATFLIVPIQPRAFFLSTTYRF
ncbi:hypothetical protein AW736_23075 [Termitidicoccus mucosus]|uniref:TonB-dependent receptor plug domain-containing protein n=2 Tax=Termitidicoccus mucosus TaxID=1184151 RepID=A0A178IBU0_9BACT|nr:hypothetical protein AW736_23075 [Opitutaceae bacterium TSB47]